MIAVNVNAKSRIAFISSYSPRRCGIATFTSDLIRNVGPAGGRAFEPLVIALDSGGQLRYQQPVKLTIRRDLKYDYLYAADRINFSDAEVVCLQHEFGLFGGDAGCYINLLLQRLNKPVVTTLHTVLDKPSADYFASLTGVCRYSDKLVVMNRRGIKMLQTIYGVPADKIELIPHGIPDLPFADSEPYKRRLGLAGRKTILTFGLLSKNKGIEVMLQALPAIVKADPSVIYIVLGAVHPEVLRNEGPAYKLKLEKMVSDLGLAGHVVFHNRFVSDSELHRYLGAADIYVTPYLHKQQVTSGTLAFAVGAGKAVVSTAYWAAEELLADGRGRLVRFGDAEHVARSIVDILSNDLLFHSMRRRAWEHGRSMTWPRVGRHYRRLFQAQRYLASTPLSPAGFPASRMMESHPIYQTA